MLFGGFLVNVDSLPVPLKYCQFLSPYKYALEAILVNEMHGRVILFNPPDAEYTFQMRGEMILEVFGFSVDHFALDLGVISGLALSSILLAGLLLQLCVKERR
jgi:ATP-binding cassette subfamily G (WHITE) protein 2